MINRVSNNSQFLLIINILFLPFNLLLANEIEIWKINPADFSNTMTMTALVTVDSTDMNEGSLAAFVGNEIRGLQDQLGFPPFGLFVGRPMFQITIYTNSGGEDLTFRWSSDGTQTNSILVFSNSSITSSINGNDGSVTEPILLAGNNQLTTPIDVSSLDIYQFSGFTPSVGQPNVPDGIYAYDGTVSAERLIPVEETGPFSGTYRHADPPNQYTTSGIYINPILFNLDITTSLN